MSQALKDLQEKTCKAVYGITKAEAHVQGICVDCRKSVFLQAGHYPRHYDPAMCPTKAAEKEYAISGLCDACFDKIFQFEDNPITKGEML